MKKWSEMSEAERYDLPPAERQAAHRDEWMERDPWRSSKTLTRDAAGRLVLRDRPAQQPSRKLTDQEYDRLSFSEKVLYAERMSGL
jgi:hypothetical protein